MVGPTILGHPPIRQATVVRSDAEHTFRVFVAEIGTWWPVVPFSLGDNRVAGVTVEPRRGGRVYETWDDGREVAWGEVLAWEPPARFAMTWTITAQVTEVELTFRPLGPALTRVELEHRGWERLSGEQLREVGAFAEGWTRILSAFRTAAEG